MKTRTIINLVQLVFSSSVGITFPSPAADSHSVGFGLTVESVGKICFVKWSSFSLLLAMLAFDVSCTMLMSGGLRVGRDRKSLSLMCKVIIYHQKCSDEKRKLHLQSCSIHIPHQASR